MIRHLDDLDAARLTVDVCIVGAGAAGLTLATELDGCGLRVVVLEAGGRTVTGRDQAIYRSNVVGLGHEGVHELRYRVFGGSTTRWAGQALPLLDIDFEHRPWIDHSGWPITRDDLEPHYRRAATLMRIPPMPRVARDDWSPVLPPPPAFDAALIDPLYSFFTAEPDFSRTLGPACGSSGDVDVVLGANVTEIATDAAESAVTTITARSFAGATVTVDARAFVLCCGGIETPRLLLAADPHHGAIGNRSDHVGRWFQDHPGFDAGHIGGDVTELREAFRPRRVEGGKAMPRLASAVALQRREQLLHAAGTIVFDVAQPASLRAGKALYAAARRRERPRALRRSLSAIARDPLPLVRGATRYFGRDEPALDTSVQPVLGIGCEQAPNRDSRVRLAEEVDELGMRRASLDWRLTEREIATCRRFFGVVADELDRLGLGAAGDGFALPDDPRELSGLVIDAGHHMGTTRMSVRPEDGVVDADLQVHGIENLYIASSSVFPTSGCSNPTFTIIALCIRLADTLRARLVGS